MANVSQWNTTDASNTSAPPAGAPEAMAPSAVNDTMRAMMGAVARLREDMAADLTTTGSANAYILATNNSHAALTDIGLLVFIANHTNTGPATLAVDGLTAKNIRSNGGAIGAGQLLSGVAYAAVYNGTDDAYDLLGSSAGEQYRIKDADETVNNSATLQDDDDLTGFTLVTGAYYEVYGILRANLISTSGIKISLTFTNGIQLGVLQAVRSNDGSGTDENATSLNATDTNLSIASGASGLNIIVVSGMFQANGSTGGTMKVQWAQVAATAQNTQLLEGSYLKIRRIT